MNPFAMEIFVRKQRGNVRLMIPLLVIWLLLLPFALVVLPLFLIACAVYWVNPFRLFGSFWMMFTGLKGTHIEVNENKHSVLIRIP